MARGRQQAADYVWWPGGQGDPWKELPEGGEHHYPRVLDVSPAASGAADPASPKGKTKTIKKQKGPETHCIPQQPAEPAQVVSLFISRQPSD